MPDSKFWRVPKFQILGILLLQQGLAGDGRLRAERQKARQERRRQARNCTEDTEYRLGREYRIEEYRMQLEEYKIWWERQVKLSS